MDNPAEDNKVEVKVSLCEQVGRELKKLKFRSSFHNREYISFKAPAETKLQAYLLSLAICHQTHTLVNHKRNLTGWDLLEYVFVNLAKSNNSLLDPKYVAGLSTEKLSEKLRPLFSDDGKPENCTLDRLEERTGLWIDIAQKLTEKYGGKLLDLVRGCDGFLVDEGKGLYEVLEQFEAYKDPARKKSSCFVKFAAEAGLLSIKDDDNAVPIMDYHMQRVLLRSGCIEVLSPELEKKLKNRENLDSDAAVRDASIDAMRLIAKVSGYNVLMMNDFFYPLGRSCCQEKMLCVDGKCNKDPCSLELVMELPSHDSCVLEGMCKSSKSEEYRKMWQPMVKTHFY